MLICGGLHEKKILQVAGWTVEQLLRSNMMQNLLLCNISITLNNFVTMVQLFNDVYQNVQCVTLLIRTLKYNCTVVSVSCWYWSMQMGANNWCKYDLFSCKTSISPKKTQMQGAIQGSGKSEVQRNFLSMKVYYGTCTWKVLLYFAAILSWLLIWSCLFVFI